MATMQNDKFSPYFTTPVNNGVLDIWQPRDFRKLSTDVFYQIDAVYEFRPDMLSNDLYGTPKLWWVFAVRNPDVIQDPVFDFKSGISIFIPKLQTLQTDLSI